MRDALLRLEEQQLYRRVAVPGSFAGTEQLPADIISVVPQAVIRSYRIDFLVVGKYRGPIIVAVECDGHEWHERTPTQAQRDKSRDRVLQSLGMQVLRFTGREIWQNPDKCALEVATALDAEIFRRMC